MTVSHFPSWYHLTSPTHLSSAWCAHSLQALGRPPGAAARRLGARCPRGTLVARARPPTGVRKGDATHRHTLIHIHLHPHTHTPTHAYTHTHPHTYTHISPRSLPPWLFPEQDVTVDSGVTPFAPTFTGSDNGLIWGNGCDLFMGQILETPDAENTVLKAIGFYVKLDEATATIPSGFTPYGAPHPPLNGHLLPQILTSC
jgi:hypothetical protein